MYEVISEFYDLFMDDDEWIRFAVNAVKGKYKGADVGCGSGNVSIALSADHEVIAIDSSEDMLRVAANKFARHGLKIPTVLQKAQSLKLSFKADFITAMCDVVNYIQSPVSFFKAAYNNLADNGLLVFDVSSEKKLRETLNNNVFTQTKEGVTYVWENSLKGNRVDMELTFFYPAANGLYAKAIDVQTQYIHTKQALIESLISCGFDVDCTDKGDRIYFVAVKKENNGKDNL